MMLCNSVIGTRLISCKEISTLYDEIIAIKLMAVISFMFAIGLAVI